MYQKCSINCSASIVQTQQPIRPEHKNIIETVRSSVFQGVDDL